jgi:hypothetical protein
MRRCIVLILAALAVPVVLANAANTASAANVPFRRQVPATVEETPLPDGGWSRKIVQPRYEFFSLWPDHITEGSESEEVLLEQVFTFQYQTNSEGMPSKLAVTAWKSGKSRYDTKLWSFSDEGNEGDIFRYGELYRSTQHGCCASENVERIYDLRTGKLAAVSTVTPGVIEVPNTPVRRIVAYHSAAGVAGPPEAEKMPRLLGILTLSARTEVLRRVAVIDAADHEEFSPEMVLRVNAKVSDGDTDTEIALWAAEKNPIPANIGGFRVELTFLGEKNDKVVIPVEKDDFDLEKATVPAGFKLVRVK